MRAVKAPSNPLRALDLFAGCGGLTLGLKRAGFNVVGAIEMDLLAAETYWMNHPEVVLWHKDIREVSAREILLRFEMKVGELDLLAGCPPCQGFSSMRNLNGGRRITDQQNDLVYEFLRLVKGLRPKAVMLENVPGLAANRRFRELRRALHGLGYSVTAEVRDARHFGVPQRRRRLILLAGRDGLEIPLARPSNRLMTVRDAFARLPPQRAKHDPLHNLGETRSDKVKQLIGLIPKNGGGRRDLKASRQLKCHRRCDGFSDVYGRMSWDDVAPTITGGCCNPSKGRFLHPSRNRNITLREAALLQSFPVHYRFSLQRGKFPAAQMIGNALPPEFSRRHAAQIRKALGEAATR